jgi:hypothetical protein
VLLNPKLFADISTMQRIPMIFLFLVAALQLNAQETRFPRTVKLYPLNLIRSEFSVGYEHGLKQRISLSGAAGIHGSGTWSQVADGSGSLGEGCRTVWPAKGFSFKAGARFYPSKSKRVSPFYMEMLLAYRATQYFSLLKYATSPCGPGTPAKVIRPYSSRVGLQYLLGGAIKRDRRFTLDFYGGLGLNILYRDEKQPNDPSNPDIFFRPVPATSKLQGSVHLGLSLGYNFHGKRRN